MDNITNFAVGSLAESLSSTASTVVLATGHGERFPASNFNVTIWQASYSSMTAAYYSNALAIYRVLSREGDTLTFKTSNGNREAQENTTPLSHELGASIALCTTAKLFTDLDLGLTSNVSGVGFTLTGGATPHTLSVVADATVSGLNTGDTSSVPITYLNEIEKKLVLDLTQTDTSAPTGVVRFNSLGGTPSYARVDAKVYTITLTNKLTLNLTDCFMYDMTDIESITHSDINTVTITTNNDGVLTSRRVIIIVYP